MTKKGYKQTEEHKRKKGESLKGNRNARGYKWTKEQRAGLNRSGTNAPHYVDGRYLKKRYCEDCGEEIKKQGKKCRSCAARISMKEKWQKLEFKKLKSRQAKLQWQDGRMKGVFDNRKICVGCPSNPEKKIIEILKELGIEYIFQFRPKGCSKIYDFYLSENNLLIEYDGKYWHSLPGNVVRDKEKTEYAKRNGYNLLRLNEDNLSDLKSPILNLVEVEGNDERT